MQAYVLGGLFVLVPALLCACLYVAWKWRDLRLLIYGYGPIVSIGSIYVLYWIKSEPPHIEFHFLLYVHLTLGAFLAWDRLQTLKREVAFKSYYNAILDNTADGLVIIDAEGTIVLANPAAERLFGFEDQELLGKDVTVLMPADVASRHSSYIKNFLETRVPRIIGLGRELVGKRRDGKTFPLYLAVNEILIRGKPYFIGNLHDLTNLKKTEYALERERNFISKVLDTAGALILVLDAEGRVINFNKESQKLTGYSLEEVHGTFIWDILLPPEQREQARALLKTFARKELPGHYTNFILTREQEKKLIRWSNTSLRSPAGDLEHIIMIGIDVTEKDKQERELEILSRRIIQIRDEERNRIAADIHDGLGQTLIGLKFYIYDLQLRLAEKPELHKLAQEALKAIDLAVSEAREISHRLSPLALEQVGLKSAIEELADRYPNLQSEIKINKKDLENIFPDLWNVDFYRLVQEAITNVAKHARASHLWISTNFEKEELTLRIRDDGVGFDIQASSPEKGIGLSLMKARASYLGGFLEIHSEPDRGTQITLVIPARTKRS